MNNTESSRIPYGFGVVQRENERLQHVSMTSYYYIKPRKGVHHQGQRTIANCYGS